MPCSATSAAIRAASAFGFARIRYAAAAVEAPTELFQLQGEIARRNFDAVVAYGSKRTEAWVKLYNDAFAPISNRVSVAVEKVKTAA